ncbi:MAG: ACT domain-containing protein [Actinomycetota bacterium]
MAGIEALADMLRNLSVSRRPGSWTIVSIGSPVPLSEVIAAVIIESEGATAVATVAEATRRGWPVDFRGAWLTLDIHSSLDRVGLTAAVSATLAGRGIPANMLAGYYHDHLLVPEDRADEAMAAITALAAST